MERIEPYTGEDASAGKYKLYLRGDPIAFDRPIGLGKKIHLKPQGPKYAKLQHILTARSLDDIFGAA